MLDNHFVGYQADGCYLAQLDVGQPEGMSGFVGHRLRNLDVVQARHRIDEG